MSGIKAFKWKDFLGRLYDRTMEADVFSCAAQVAFYFCFALFPLLYFLVSLIGLLLDSSDDLRFELFSYLGQIMPAAVFDLVKKTIGEIVANSTGGKLTLGLLVTLWSASAGVDGLRSSLNAVYNITETRPLWKTRLQSLVLTFAVSILTAALLAIVFYGWQLVQYIVGALGFEISSPLVLVSIQWISTLLLMLLTCEVIYNLLPDLKGFRWLWVTPGSVVSIILWIVMTSGFRFYLGYFDTYNKAYGSLGAVMIMMLWLYLTALALILGGAINAVLSDQRNEAEAETPSPENE